MTRQQEINQFKQALNEYEIDAQAERRELLLKYLAPQFASVLEDSRSDLHHLVYHSRQLQYLDYMINKEISEREEVKKEKLSKVETEEAKTKVKADHDALRKDAAFKAHDLFCNAFNFFLELQNIPLWKGSLTQENVTNFLRLIISTLKEDTHGYYTLGITQEEKKEMNQIAQENEGTKIAHISEVDFMNCLNALAKANGNTATVHNEDKGYSVDTINAVNAYYIRYRKNFPIRPNTHVAPMREHGVQYIRTAVNPKDKNKKVLYPGSEFARPSLHSNNPHQIRLAIATISAKLLTHTKMRLAELKTANDNSAITTREIRQLEERLNLLQNSINAACLITAKENEPLVEAQIAAQLVAQGNDLYSNIARLQAAQQKLEKNGLSLAFFHQNREKSSVCDEPNTPAMGAAAAAAAWQ